MKVIIEDSALFAKMVAKELADQLQKQNFLDTGVRKQENQTTKFLSTKEAAQKLGVHVNSIRAWAKSNQLESVRFGNRIFIKFKETTDGFS
jgi:excisionase family DNA binding protein